MNYFAFFAALLRAFAEALPAFEAMAFRSALERRANPIFFAMIMFLIAKRESFRYSIPDPSASPQTDPGWSTEAPRTRVSP